MPADADLLAAIPLFSPLDRQERLALAQVVEVVRLPVGQIVFAYGDHGDALFVLRSGRVEIFLTDDMGRRIVLETVGPGDFFGELGLLAPSPRTSGAVVTADMEALRVDRDDLERFLQIHPTVALDLLDVVGARLRASNEFLRHSAARNVNDQLEDTRTVVARVSDGIAAFSGSLPFLALNAALFLAWIVINTGLVPHIAAFDPFPFGLLTLAVSLEAIFLSIFVLLSQNRQAAKDHVRADVEYDVNLKAELEVAELHRKVDHLNAELQRVLTTVHADLGARLDRLLRTAADASPSAASRPPSPDRALQPPSARGGPTSGV